jgi:hypothetical protein
VLGRLLRCYIEEERLNAFSTGVRMHFDKSFGSLQIDGNIYTRDVVIDRGDILKRKKKPSKKFREQFGHTPLSADLGQNSEDTNAILRVTC